MTPRFQRQVLVYVSLLGLTLVYRLFAPDLRGDALGGLIFLALAGGVGANHLFDHGYKTWAVWLICGSLLASALTLFGLLKEGALVALFASFLWTIPAFLVFHWGQSKDSPKHPQNRPRMP